MDKLSFQPKTVTQAKQQFIAAAERIDYLAPVKKYPIRSLLIAFSAGVIMDKKSGNKNYLSPSLLPLFISMFRDL